MLASLSCAACWPSRLKDGNCYIGEAGCSCTFRGGCDPGLWCGWDRVCVEPPEDSEPEWIPIGDSGTTAGDAIASHDVARDFHDLLVVDRQMFLTYRDEQMIRVLDLDDGFVTEIPVDGFAERIAADVSVGMVVVTIAPGHDGPLEETGQLALVDASSHAWQVVALPIIPGDVVTNGAGTAFVSMQSFSDSNGSAVAIDLVAGTFVRYFGDDYIGSDSIVMPPSVDRIYALETNWGSGHIARWNVDGPTLTDTIVGAPDYLSATTLALHPTGHVAYLRDGTIVTLTDDPSLDMFPEGDLGPDGRWEDIAFDPTGARAYTIPTQGLGIRIYDTKSADQVGEYRATDEHSIERIAAGPTSLFVAERSWFNPSSMMRIDEVAFP